MKLSRLIPTYTFLFLLLGINFLSANVVSYNPSTGVYRVDQYGASIKPKDLPKDHPNPKKYEMEGAQGCEMPQEPKGRNGTLPPSASVWNYIN